MRSGPPWDRSNSNKRCYCTLQGYHVVTLPLLCLHSSCSMKCPIFSFFSSFYSFISMCVCWVCRCVLLYHLFFHVNRDEKERIKSVTGFYLRILFILILFFSCPFSFLCSCMCMCVNVRVTIDSLHVYWSIDRNYFLYIWIIWFHCIICQI